MPPHHWGYKNLFTAWQKARNVTHVPITPALVRWFLTEVPGGDRFVQNIFHIPSTSVWEVIRATPAYGAQKDRVHGGVWGRRDAVVVWLHYCGLTLAEIQQLTVDDLGTDRRVGPLFRTHRDAQVCPACVLARWKQILSVSPPWGGRLAALNLVAAPPHPGHACQEPEPDNWRGAYVALPSIDRHGWVGSVNLSTRAMSDILKLRYGRVGVSPTRARSRPHRRLTASEVAALLGELDVLTEDLLQRVEDEFG